MSYLLIVLLSALEENKFKIGEVDWKSSRYEEILELKDWNLGADEMREWNRLSERNERESDILDSKNLLIMVRVWNLYRYSST